MLQLTGNSHVTDEAYHQVVDCEAQSTDLGQMLINAALVSSQDWDTCFKKPDCFIGVAAKLGGIDCSGLGGTLEECKLGVAVVHKALADAAIGGHVVADLS